MATNRRKTMTLAAMKRRINAGATITMTGHDRFPNGKLIGVPRTAITVQTNGVQFEGGSWLFWPKASEFEATAEGFRLRFGLSENDMWMTYTVAD